MAPFSRPHHICIVVENLERALAFYERVGIGPWRPLPSFDDLVELEGVDAEELSVNQNTQEIYTDTRFTLTQPDSKNPGKLQVITGTGLLVVLYALPGGFGQLFITVRDKYLIWVANRRDIIVPSLVADKRAQENAVGLLQGALSEEPAA